MYVMLIDDHDDSRELSAMVLANAGFDVIEFANAEDAFASLDTQIPHVVVTDITLPGMDGHAAATRFREDARTARVPVIALTGRSDALHQKRAFVAVLVKPVLPEKLVEAVGKYRTANDSLA